jgi:hypothetical protein
MRSRWRGRDGPWDRRKCKCCLKLFRPDPPNRRHQYYCSASGCRAASKAASQARWLARIGQEGKWQRITDIAGTLSATARNGRLRERRREIWRRAEAATRYWRVRLDFHDAVEIAQHREVPEARYHPIVNSEDRYPMVRRYREALMKQPLTPAPDANSVKWKQWALAGANIVSPT